MRSPVNGDRDPDMPETATLIKAHLIDTVAARRSLDAKGRNSQAEG